MINFSNVSKSFRRVQVLNALDLVLKQGDRVALVGSNGAGKTTLIRCLLGEYTCEGEVTVAGLNPREHRSEVLGRIGFVPQLPPPLKMPVGQLLEFAASLCNSEIEEMITVASRLGLDAKEVWNRPFVKLSGGQKQKLLIGIALGRNGDVLVLDEPAANLDPDARRVFFSLLAEQKDRSAMLISSHRLDEVSALVNRVIELDQGRVVLDDSVEELVDISASLSCRITLIRQDEAFAKAIVGWGFQSSEGGQIWEGRIAGPDRLRFLGVLSRYAGVLSGVQLEE